MKLKLIFREMYRQKVALLLNVVCLSIAFSVLFIVMKQVKYDFSYDSSYPKGENIYRLGRYNQVDGSYSTGFSMPLIHRMMSMTPGITEYTILGYRVHQASFYNGETEYEEAFMDVTSGFVEVFQPRILAGDAVDALKNRTGMVIPQSLARKWFGREDPIGKMIGFGNKNNHWVVKAVYEDFPENSSVANAVYTGLEENEDGSEWSYHCFFRIEDQVDSGVLVEKMIQGMDSLAMMESGGKGLYTDIATLMLTQMKDIYFDPDFRETYDSAIKLGNLSLTLCLLAIGILIIVVAYINFINFSTALAPVRIGAMNICKISGASAGELKSNVILEAVFLSLFACLLSVVWSYGFSITSLAKTYFNASLNPAGNQGLYLILGGGAVVLGVLAGIYPAAYLTSFQPALVLKGSFSLSASGRKLRNGLLTFQFVVTIVLIIASLFIVIQHRYLLNQSWGFQKENIVYISIDESLRESPEVFRNELLKNPDVLDMTSSRYVPGKEFMGWGRFFMDKAVQFEVWPVAPDFLTFFNIPVVEGKNFGKPAPGKDYLIFNRKAVEKYGLKEAIGGKIGCFNNSGTVIGIAENINFASLHHEVEPMAFVCGDDMWDNYIFIKIRPERIPETIRYIQSCCKDLGSKSCEITFLEDSIHRLYQQEESLSGLISLFCFITILISLAGIYGLLIFNIRYKVKEIGIRKMNGAGVWQIVLLLNRIFIRLIAIGFVIACPLAYWLVSGWLSGYPYRTPIVGWVFVVAGLLTLLITWGVVSYQSWKAATSNPVDSLKGE